MLQGLKQAKKVHEPENVMHPRESQKEEQEGVSLIL